MLLINLFKFSNGKLILEFSTRFTLLKASELILVNIDWVESVTKTIPENPIYLHFLDEITEMGVMWLTDTVLGYKKGSKTKNIFSSLENMMFQLSNALSIIFISLILVKLRQIKVLSAAPPKGHSAP